MEADRSQDLQANSARWRADGGVPVQRLAGLRPSKRRCLSSSPKAGKCQCFSSKTLRQDSLTWRRIRLFVLFRPSPDWMGPTTFGRAICFIQSNNFNVKLIKNTLIKISRITCDQISGHPVT